MPQPSAHDLPAQPDIGLPLSHTLIDVGELRLHVAQAGQGAPILFLHGFPEFWYAWRKQLPDFARDHQVIAPDLRGFNLSDKPAGSAPYRMKSVVGDLIGLLDALQLPQVVVVAHDWGGAAAWQMAIHAPQRISRLVVLNAPHPWCFARELASNPAQQRASGYFHRFAAEHAAAELARDGYAALRPLLSGSRAGAEALRADELEHYLAAWARPGALEASLGYYRATPLQPPSAQAAPATLDPANLRVRVPTLLIWGEADSALLPSLVDGTEHVVDALQVVRIADATHWVAWEFPQRVNAAIRAFIGAPAQG